MKQILTRRDLILSKIEAVSPTLTNFYSEDNIVEILSRGEDIAKRLMSEKNQLEIDTMRELEERKKSELIKVETIKQKAREEGLELGRKEFVEKYKDFFKLVESSRKEAETLRADLVKNTEDEMVELTLKIAEKLVMSEFISNRDLYIKMLKFVLKHNTDKTKVFISVHPLDYDVLDENIDILKKEAGMLKEFGIRKDSSISRGGAMFEMESGVIDIGIDTQIKKIREAFKL
ncbi:MAG: hypothetical protein A2Y40_08175 [Candidatus Margulisbacteria bacterium GWF2_35_9]|nr:MAG: hypothetical protein A2Y40_08175 [Candidatus Margulisbacteria bacterium GWF2_35_9]